MSTASPKNTPQNEEIDLGVLFNSIGKGISAIVTFIGNVIMTILNGLAAYAVFVRTRIVIFALACGLGLLAGIALDMMLPKKFVASATLEPHFDSARQLYSNVAYLNDLAEQQDTLQLASFFGIDPSEAAEIMTIEIAPLTTKAAQLKEYNDYYIELDSIVAEETNFKEFTKGLKKHDNRIHMVKVQSSNQTIFPRLLDPILNSVAEIAYFRKKQATELQNLELSDSITQVSIVQTDSLLALFEKVRIIEAKRELSNGTNLYMSERAENNTEISLLNRKITLSKELEQIRTDKLRAQQVIDVVSSFPEYGYIDTSLIKNKKFIGLVLGFAVINLFYLILYLDRFLMSRTSS